MGNMRFKSKPKKKVAVTRKQIRKEKRQEKKTNRSEFYRKSKEFHQKSKQTKKGDPKTKPTSKIEDDDDEIPSDFDDDEDVNIHKMKAPQLDEISQIEKDRIAEMNERAEYENELKRKRLDQLVEQNEEEDKVIRKYEKLLKLNKKKGKKEIPFDDGLDYALELCTPESIQKMYAAAKDAAAEAEGSKDELMEDLEIAMGKKLKATKDKASKKTSAVDIIKIAKEKKHIGKLKAIEQKYFGDEINLDEDVDSLGGSDSEFENEEQRSASDDNHSDNGIDSSSNEDVVEEPIKKSSSKSKKISFKMPVKEPSKKKSKTMVSDSDNSDFDLLESGDDISEIGNSNGFSSDEEEATGTDDSEAEKVMQQLKNRKKSKYTIADDPDSDPEVQSVFEKLKNRRKGEEKYVPPHARKQEETHSTAEEESDPEADSVWEQLKNRRKNQSSGSDAKSNKAWEDIYGRKRDKDGKVVEETSEKYVPPHVRARLEAENSEDPKRQEKLLRLKKQLKGQLNRLAESNLHRIANDFDSLYMQNARFDMNNTLTNLILDAVVADTLSPDRMVLEHTLLVAILHANVGSEVGAHFLQILVEKFNAKFHQFAECAIENKQLDNIVLVMCHLYTYQVFHHSLIYEILNKLSAQLHEKSVECILLVLRSIGFILRKDNPLALKEFILKVQKSAAAVPDQLKNDPRIKYMLESLMAIKNNNMTKIPQYDPSLVEHFRKLLKGMVTNGKYVTTLNITMDDLLNADQRGKWWLIGSAWAGNEKTDSRDASKPQPKSGGSEFSQKLLDLARKQRMNTDDRRSVFCIVMSAEDYVDAFEKIVQLSIKDQRTIVTVIIHCCLSEKDFNPYYAVLSQKFCDHDRKYVLAIQFALWDRLRDLQALTKVQIKNLAQYIIYLVSHGGQPLSVLKVIEFGELDKVTLRLVRQIMLGLLMGPEAVCEQVFERIAPSFKLNAFKDSIRLFLHHFLLKGANDSAISDEQIKLLKKRIQLADKSLQTTDSRIVF